jgi:hypothetical protein
MGTWTFTYCLTDYPTVINNLLLQIINLSLDRKYDHSSNKEPIVSC